MCSRKPLRFICLLAAPSQYKPEKESCLLGQRGCAPYVTDSPQNAEALLPGHTLWASCPFVKFEARYAVFASLPRLRPARRLVLNYGGHPVRREVFRFAGRRTAQGKRWPLPFY